MKLRHVSLKSYEFKDGWHDLGYVDVIVEDADPRYVAVTSMMSNFTSDDDRRAMADHVVVTPFRGGAIATVRYDDVDEEIEFGAAGSRSYSMAALPTETEELKRAGTSNGARVYSLSDFIDVWGIREDFVHSIVEMSSEHQEGMRA